MRGVRPFAVAGGSALYRAGDPPDAIYLVRAGAFGVFREGAMGRSLVGMLRPGDVVGEFGLIAGTPRSATVVALRDSEVAAMPGAGFLAAARRQGRRLAVLDDGKTSDAERDAIAAAMSSPLISLSCSTSRFSKSSERARRMSRVCSPASTSCRA